jgi:hypothetical protein
MDIRHTRGLDVYVDPVLPIGEIVIHPNDGFDLGLINTRHAVSICLQKPVLGGMPAAVPGAILLKNSCRSGTLHVSPKQWELMGKEKSVTLFMKTDTVFIVGPQSK